MRKIQRYVVLFIAGLGLLILLFVLVRPGTDGKPLAPIKKEASAGLWQGPGAGEIPLDSDSGQLIAYGRELIANTSSYLGPYGSVMHITNGLNCQNCHLDAGTKPWGNNYGGVYSTYPKMRSRSGTVEDIYKRINDCLERSLNGQSLDTTSRELRAIYAYMKWVGKDVPKKEKPAGTGIMELPPLDRAADPVKGKQVFLLKCQRCHGADGQGFHKTGTMVYEYPPLWGPESYTTAAGLYRLSRFAGLVKNNMPFGTRYDSTDLSDEEAWDVAAYVNSQPRPVKTYRQDWPDISKKPFDHPFGPYADSFSQEQHKYGPYGPIRKESAAKPQ